MPLNNFGIVTKLGQATLFRSAQPDEDGCKTLSSIGVSHIVRLNDGDSPTTMMEKQFLGGEVIYIPIPTFSVNVDTVKEIVAEIAKCLAQVQNILVHCTHGRDRTGLIIGAYRLIYQGWTLEKVNAERELYGVNFLVGIGDHSIELALETIAKECAIPPGP
jgi:tyrosine-protein phosphatase SIW14